MTTLRTTRTYKNSAPISPPQDGLLRVETWFGAVFGLDVVDGRIATAAPIAKWSRGKPVREVIDYYVKNGATVEWAL